MRQTLTKRQRDVFDFIHGHIQSKGYSPSFSEIGQALGLSSPASIHRHLENLVSKGWIRRGGTKKKSWRLIELIELERQKCPNCGFELHSERGA